MKMIIKIMRVLNATVRLAVVFVFKVIVFAFSVIADAATSFSGTDEHDSSDNYEMGKVFNYNSQKYDNGYRQDGWYDDWN